MAFWKDFQGGFDFGWKAGNKYQSRRDLEALQEQQKAGVTGTEDIYDDMNDNKGLGTKSTGGSNKMGGPWDAPDGSAPVAPEGLTNTKSSYDYLGQSYDQAPDRWQQQAAYNNARADIFDKYDQGDRADKARAMGLQSEKYGADDKWKSKDFEYKVDQDTIKNDQADRRLDLDEQRVQSQIEMDKVTRQSRGLDMKIRETEFKKAQDWEKAIAQADTITEPTAKREFLVQERGRLFGPEDATAWGNKWTQGNLQAVEFRAKEIDNMLNKAISTNKLDTIVSAWDSIDDGTDIYLNPLEDGTAELVVATPEGDIVERVGTGAKTNAELIAAIKSRLEQEGTHNIAANEFERKQNAAKLSAEEKRVGIDKDKAVTKNERNKSLDAAKKSRAEFAAELAATGVKGDRFNQAMLEYDKQFANPYAGWGIQVIK